jgi:hypothetical protein
MNYPGAEARGQTGAYQAAVAEQRTVPGLVSATTMRDEMDTAMPLCDEIEKELGRLESML